MARRLNKRLVVNLLVFLVFPLAVAGLVLLVIGRQGDPQAYVAAANEHLEKGELAKAWISIRLALKEGGAKDPAIQYRAGQIAMKQEPPAVGAALVAYRNAVILKPDFFEAQRDLAELFTRAQRWNEARAEIDRLIAMDATFGKAYMWGAILELQQGDAEPVLGQRPPYYEAAVARCRAGIEHAPAAISLYQLLVQAYEKLKQTDKIDEVLNLAVANNPKSPEAYSLKAARQTTAGEVDKAVETLKHGLQEIGDDGILYLTLAEVLFKKKDTEQARECLQKAITADPKLEAAYIRLSGLQRIDQDQAAALATLEQGLKALPESIALRAEVADIYLDQRDMEKAAAVIAEVEKASPENALAYYLRGKRALMERRAHEASALLQTAVERKPTPQARFLLAQAYNMAGELGAAAKEFASIVSDLPGWAAPRRALAQIQFNLREYPRAASNAKIVLEARPDDTEMRLLLAMTLLAQDDTAGAIKEIQKAADLKPDDPDAHLMMAGILKKDRPAEAEAAIRRAIATGKDLARGYQQLIQLYRDTKQQEKLAQAIEQAKKALPDTWYQITAASSEELERELKKRVEEDPSRVTDALRLAEVYRATEQPEKAVELLGALLAKLPTDSNDWRQAWQQLFTVHLAANEYDKAAKLVDRLKEVSPDAPEAAYASALVALSQEKLDEAAGLLRDAVQRRASSQGFFLLGQVLAQQRKYDEAVVQFQKAVELKPNLVAARLSLCRLMMIRGNYAGAVLEAAEALKHSPRLVAALELKAAAHAGEGAWASAIDARESIRAIAPENINNLVVLAALYRQQLHPEKAEAVFADASKRAPDNPKLVQRFAEFYAQTGRPDKGTALLDEYVSRNADKASAHVLRGDYAAGIAGPAEAEKYYRKAADLAPEDPMPLILLGDQYGRAREWDAAIKAYTEAGKRAKDKDVVTVQLRLADAQMLKGNLDEALKTAKTVLTKDPKDAQSMVVVSRILAKQGEEAKAVALLEKATVAAPDYGEAKFRLARLLMGSDMMKSLDLLNTVDPTDAAFDRSMILRAAINNRRGLPNESILDLRRLLDFRPESQEARRLLAGLYMAAHDPARAAQVLEALVADHPKDADLLVALGDALVEKRDYRGALQRYTQARMLNPVLPSALVGEARSLVYLNRKEEALKRVFDVMNVLPVGAAWPRLALVSVYELTGEQDKAIEALRVGIERQPDWEVGRLRLAGIYIKEQKAPLARAVLAEGLQLLPDSVIVRTELAKIELSLNDAKTAKERLEVLVKKFEVDRKEKADDPDQLGVYVGPLGTYSLALYRLGRIDEAIAWAKVVWKLSPTDVANSNNLAWMLATERKALTEATDLIRQCLRLMPTNPQVLDTAGWIAYLRGDLGQAQQYLTDSTRQGDNADARYHLGRTYEARERPEDAREQYQQAIKLGLLGKDLADAKQRLTTLGG